MAATYEQLERMYNKVTRGRSSGPDLLHLPPVLGTMIDDDGFERRVYKVRPAIFNQRGDGLFATFSNAKPNTNFWGLSLPKNDLKEALSGT